MYINLFERFNEYKFRYDIHESAISAARSGQARALEGMRAIVIERAREMVNLNGFGTLGSRSADIIDMWEKDGWYAALVLTSGPALLVTAAHENFSEAYNNIAGQRGYSTYNKLETYADLLRAMQTLDKVPAPSRP